MWVHSSTRQINEVILLTKIEIHLGMPSNPERGADMGIFFFLASHPLVPCDHEAGKTVISSTCRDLAKDEYLLVLQLLSMLHGS